MIKLIKNIKKKMLGELACSCCGKKMNNLGEKHGYEGTYLVCLNENCEEERKIYKLKIKKHYTRVKYVHTNQSGIWIKDENNLTSVWR